jgi:hypothetical protein
MFVNVLIYNIEEMAITKRRLAMTVATDTRKEAIELMIEMMERVRQCLNTDSSSAKMELDTLSKSLVENFANVDISNDEVKRQMYEIMNQRERLSLEVNDSDKKVVAINEVLDLFSKKKKRKIVFDGLVKVKKVSSEKPEGPVLTDGHELAFDERFRELDSTNKVILLVGILFEKDRFVANQLINRLNLEAVNLTETDVSQVLSRLSIKPTGNFFGRKGIQDSERNDVTVNHKYFYWLTVRGMRRYKRLRSEMPKFDNGSVEKATSVSDVELPLEGSGEALLKRLRASSQYGQLQKADKLICFIGCLQGKGAFYVKHFAEQVQRLTDEFAYDYLRSAMSSFVQSDSRPLEKKPLSKSDRARLEHVTGASFQYKLSVVGWKRFSLVVEKLTK